MTRGSKTSRAWPVMLREKDTAGVIVLRPLHKRDGQAWIALRERNFAWLDEWEATSPRPQTGPAPSFAGYVRMLRAQARSGSALPFAVELDGELVGQLTVSSITFGSLCSAAIGYWISEHVAGRGVMPSAVAMAIDHSFATLGLHRIEINIRPENRASLRVVEKLGMRDEGVRRRYLHIQGRWRDHRTFAITSEEVPEGMTARLRARRKPDVGPAGRV